MITEAFLGGCTDEQLTSLRDAAWDAQDSYQTALCNLSPTSSALATQYAELQIQLFGATATLDLCAEALDTRQQLKQ